MRRYDQRVLILAPFGRDAAEISLVLADAGFDVVACADGGALCREIQRGAAAALLAEEALDDELRNRLAGTLAEQPTWSDFPLLVMTSHVRKKRNSWKALQGIERTAHLSLLERPLHINTLLSVVRTATHARRRQYQVRDAMAARARSEAALRESEAKLQLALHTAEAGVWQFDVANNRTHLDEGARSIFGVTEVTLPRKTLWSLIHPEDRRRLAKDVQKALAVETGGPTFAEDYRILHPNGSLHWIHIRGQVFFEGTARSRRPVRAFGVLLDITRRKQAEEALHRMNETLELRVEERTQQVRELSSMLTMAEQAERQRISQILHDNLQQQLYGIRMKMSYLKRNLDKGNAEKLREDVAEAEAWLLQSIMITRNLTLDLTPPILKSEGFSDTLHWLGGRMQKLYGLEVDLAVEPSDLIPDDDMQVLLFQIVRELLFNVAKHADTDRATVTLQHVDNKILIQVTDDGKGFDVAAAEAAQKDGFGLFSVRERLRLIGGDLKIDSAPGKGTRNTIIVPLRLRQSRT